MNILLVTDSMAIGGSLTYLTNVLFALNKLTDIYLTVVTFGESPIHIDLHLNKNKYSYKHLKVKGSHSLKSLPVKTFLLWHFFWNLKIKPDIILTDLVAPSIPVLICKNLFKITKKCRHVYQFHGSTMLEKKSAHEFDTPLFGRVKQTIHHFLEQCVLRQINEILVFSKYSKKLLQYNYSNLPKITITSPGVDYRLSRKVRRVSKHKAREIIGFTTTKPIFLLISRIDKRKGIEEALQNFKKHYHGNGQFVICSNFDLPYFNIFTTISQLKLGAKVKVVNSPNHLQRSLLYRSATATLMTSLDLETFGFVSIESYFFGTPVVGFKIGANAEVISDKTLIPVNNWKQYYSTLEKIEKNQITNAIKHNNKPNWQNYISVLTKFT